jgi:hypothetical protein
MPILIKSGAVTSGILVVTVVVTVPAATVCVIVVVAGDTVRRVTPSQQQDL